MRIINNMKAHEIALALFREMPGYARGACVLRHSRADEHMRGRLQSVLAELRSKLFDAQQKSRQ